MSGGISAIKGFDYQATVILDKLFNHFDRHGPSAKARPEGIDDLDLSWSESGAERRQYVQIKKPTEDCNGNLNPTTWTLSATVKELLPSAIKHLLGNGHSQLWIVGDRFDDAVASLINARDEAPIAVPLAYWSAVHSLARNEMLAALEVESVVRKKILLWKISFNLPANPEEAQSILTAEFGNFARGLGANEDICSQYAANVTELHGCLPGVLARIEILAIYGSEQDVIQRVYDQLTQRYSLPSTVIENTLFRNLRGFINDIAKQPGRSFNQEELEVELRCVWPQMIPIKNLPVLDPDHVTRRDLAERFTTGWIGKAIEAIGISGSGKTTLTAEIAERSRITAPDRLVYYAEVRSNISLRDVLVGVAFHLRRQGIREPFSIAVKRDTTEEDILAYLARSYSTVPREILLLIDLVEGTCSTAFSRDLAIFIRALPSSSCRIAVFGQESAMRELTLLERNEHNVSRLDIRGFAFEEFVKLVSYHHPSSDRAALWDIYHHVTAGRAAGLFAKLAQTLAKAASLQDMFEMATKPAEDILAHAEQLRFARISEGARSAAERLVCFALPFLRADTEEIFPDENIGMAIRELLTQGLLGYHDKDSFEMHETVRAGLEGMLAIDVRHSTHQALAAWYSTQGLVTAEIHHLEKAGKSAEAQMRAREIFLRGEQWSAVSAYVIRNKLISVKDVIDVIAGCQTVEHIFLLTSILRNLGEPTPISELLRIIREHPQRYFSDYRWSSAIVETILEFDPGQLNSLITFSINNAINEGQAEFALSWLKVAMQRKGGAVTSQTIEFFNAQQPQIKRILLGILLRDRRREALRAAFQFLTSSQEPTGEREKLSVLDFSLHIDNLNDAVELLAAMPRVQVAAMLVSKSALLGPLANLVWSERAKLRTHCIEVLKSSPHEEIIIENAIRVLIFLAEPLLFSLCEPFLSRKDGIRAFAALLPILQPAFSDYRRYEVQILDRNAALEDRFIALSMLASAGADLGYIYHRLKAIETDFNQGQAWDFLFLMSSIQSPFPEAIALLEAHMGSLSAKESHLAIPALMKLGELPASEATTMLTRALIHSNPEIRRSAALGLARRRSHIALAALIDQYAKEDEEPLAVGLATAIVASGANSALDLQSRHTSPAIQLWQFILTMRLRDESMADRLVSVALDPFLNWQVRRAAIFAAGRLPYDIALARILPIIMDERSPLTIDHSENLGCHSLISSFLTSSHKEWPYVFAKGRDFFINFFAGIFEEIWSDRIIKQDLPSGADAAGWFYDRLAFHEWPTRHDAPDRVLNELNVPLLQGAVLRSLRLCGRPELIEQQLATANHIWIAMKCLTERRRAGNINSELAARLQSLVEASPCQGNVLLHRVIDEINNRRATASEVGPATVVPYGRSMAVSYITYDDAVRALSGTVTNFKATSPLVLESITAEQCERLIRLADPTNDPHQGVETYIPLIQFTSNGHIVARQQWTSTGSGESPNALIRPAIAVANNFGLSIPWQQELMTRAWSRDFVKKYLACLGALNDSFRFYEELSKYEDVLILSLCDVNQCEPIRKYIDARIIPTLMRYITSGTDELFEGLCMLALQVNTPEIEPVLSGLLYRWSQRFDRTSIASQHDGNISLWRGFREITEHPRFTSISGWMSLLEQVLQTRIQWLHAQDIVRVLERDPRSYILIESRLFKAENWEHFYQEEIDRLDDAAERLFVQLLEK
jgi:hypothetical protein